MRSTMMRTIHRIDFNITNFCAGGLAPFNASQIISEFQDKMAAMTKTRTRIFIWNFWLILQRQNKSPKLPHPTTISIRHTPPLMILSPWSLHAFTVLHKLLTRVRAHVVHFGLERCHKWHVCISARLLALLSIQQMEPWDGGYQPTHSPLLCNSLSTMCYGP